MCMEETDDTGFVRIQNIAIFISNNEVQLKNPATLKTILQFQIHITLQIS